MSADLPIEAPPFLMTSKRVSSVRVSQNSAVEKLAGDAVICPLHGWKINVESCGYPVEVRDGDVYVCVPEGS